LVIWDGIFCERRGRLFQHPGSIHPHSRLRVIAILLPNRVHILAGIGSDPRRAAF
jgi:hypothetical protein